MCRAEAPIGERRIPRDPCTEPRMVTTVPVNTESNHCNHPPGLEICSPIADTTLVIRERLAPITILGRTPREQWTTARIVAPSVIQRRHSPNPRIVQCKRTCTDDGRVHPVCPVSSVVPVGAAVQPLHSIQFRMLSQFKIKNEPEAQKKIHRTRLQPEGGMNGIYDPVSRLLVALLVRSGHCTSLARISRPSGSSLAWMYIRLSVAVILNGPSAVQHR